MSLEFSFRHVSKQSGRVDDDVQGNVPDPVLDAAVSAPVDGGDGIARNFVRARDLAA